MLRMLWYISSKCYKSVRSSFLKHFPHCGNVSNRWNSHPLRWKGFTSHFSCFLRQMFVIYAKKTHFSPSKLFLISCFFNSTSFLLFSDHIYAINAQKTVFFSFQNISTNVDSIFISWMADSTWGKCFKLFFAYTIHLLKIGSYTQSNRQSRTVH